VAALVTLAAGLMVASAVPAGAATTFSVGPIVNVSGPCSSQNAEAEQAVDPSGSGYVYEIWMGCQGIGFARSTNGGASFGPPISLPGAGSSTSTTWDPTIAVAPNGTVYAAFIVSKGGQYYPVIDASSDHGQSFPR
jgi:hypothetical protein